MNDKELKLLISDFDGTLVDTKTANFLAYRRVLGDRGVCLTKEMYDACFGLRVTEFMHQIGIHDPLDIIEVSEMKSIIYPDFFSYIKLNESLVNFMGLIKGERKHIAIASTAQRLNLENILNYFGLSDFFDYIITGADIKEGKPHPECYTKVMEYFNVAPLETLIFEDSKVGIEAAKASGANYIVVKKFFYGD